MFYSSKCEDCKKYAPVWDVLANEFANNPIALIGAVNCLNPKSRNLCLREGINKMPSVKYGDPDNLEFYTGKGMLEDLVIFGKKNLRPFCAPDDYRIRFCSKKEYEKLQNFLNNTIDELEDMIEEQENLLKEANTNFTEQTEILNDYYNVFLDALKKVEREADENGYSIMKKIKEMRLEEKTKKEEVVVEDEEEEIVEVELDLGQELNLDDEHDEL